MSFPTGHYTLLADLNSLSLYIHIPFCVQRCRYCDFYSETGVGTEVIRKTMDSIMLSLNQSLLRLRPGSIPTVFMGGGTPSLIPPAVLDRFLSRIDSCTGPVEEFTIETNPESLSREFIEVLALHNVNRISMGVQSYHEPQLSWLGRPAGTDAIRRADRLLKELWQGRLSRDLLAGLPLFSGNNHQSQTLLDSLQLAIEDNPGHLSLYELTVENGTALARDFQAMKCLPGEIAFLEEWQNAMDFLLLQGYQRYEVSNFAVVGEASLHNLNYWRMQPCLGIGPGAVSTFPDWVYSRFSRRVIRRQEPKNLKLWLHQPLDSFSEDVLDPGELALEHYMMGLRTSEGISTARFSGIFGIDPADAIPESLRRWRALKKMEYDGQFLKLTSSGMELLDTILVDIAVEVEKTDWSMQCRWPQP